MCGFEGTPAVKVTIIKGQEGKFKIVKPPETESKPLSLPPQNPRRIWEPTLTDRFEAGLNFLKDFSVINNHFW